MIKRNLCQFRAIARQIVERSRALVPLAVFAVALLTGKIADAQNPSLFVPIPGNQLADATPAQSNQLNNLRQAPTTAALQLVRVNLDNLLANRVDMPLPNEGAVPADKRDTIVRGPSDYTWIGELSTGGKAILVVRDGEVTGQIQSGLNTYSVTPLGGGVHALVKVDQAKFPPDHPHAPPVGPGAPGSRGDAATGAPETQADTTTQVDVFIAYTTAARTARGGSMAAFAQLAVDAANVAYTNSNAGVILRLVGTMEVNYTESTFDQAIDDLVAGNGVLAQVHTRRDQTSADMVMLMLNLTDFCGLASSISATAANAYATVYWDCSVSNHSFAHELGHLFGARHDPYVDSSTTPYTWGHGYTKPTWEWRTIMAYVNECQAHGVNCPRLQYFSNPSITYQGSPMGTTGTHNNARVHRDRVATVAAFRTPVTSSRNTHDFNGDGKSDIAWRNTSGTTAMWLMNGAQVSQSYGLGSVDRSWSIIGQRDFNGDGKYDWLWRHSGGQLALWMLNGPQVVSSVGIASISANWTVVGTADFNGDGRGDILWRDANSGTVAMWLMNGAQISQSASLSAVPANWGIVATGDFNGDGKRDILWRETGGAVAIWFLNGTQVASSVGLGSVATNWTVWDVGDFNGAFSGGTPTLTAMRSGC